MEHLSVIIPAYREPYLNKTLESIYKTAKGDIEILPVIDGYDAGEIPKDKRCRPIILTKNVGMRGAINTGLKEATGKYIMKIDAHCVFADGFDVELKKHCAENWLCIPRRYSVNEETWDRDLKMRVRDYHYISFPQASDYGFSMFTGGWEARRRERQDILIDDTMSSQGSCWFANREYFMNHVGYLDGRKEAYSGFAHEQLEVGLNYWLKGGENKVIKTTWYAHLSKRKHHYTSGMFSRRYKKNKNTYASHTWATKHWMNNEEPNTIHPISWLIEKFWPVPTWPDNWEEEWRKINETL